MHQRTLLLSLTLLAFARRATLSLPPADRVFVQAAASSNGAHEAVVERLDPKLDALLPDPVIETQIAGGYKWTESPVWLPSNKLLFAEIPSNSIRTWTPGTGVGIFLQPSGYKGERPYGGPGARINGMTLDARGRLTIAGHAQRDVWRFEGVAANDPVTLLADTYQGKRLNSPNDLVYKSDGSLYFTDPTFGLPTQAPGDPAQELKFQGVYRIPGAIRQKPGSAPGRSALQLLVKDLPQPNGIAFSPDEKYLYVDNSLPEMVWMRYRVRTDGSLTDAKVIFDAGPYAKHGAPDGMKLDRLGNIYSAGPGGVWIFSPEGKHLGTIKFDEPVGNVAWGDPDFKTLYIAASSTLFSVRVSAAGASSARQPES